MPQDDPDQLHPGHGEPDTAGAGCDPAPYLPEAQPGTDCRAAGQKQKHHPDGHQFRAEEAGDSFDRGHLDPGNDRGCGKAE